MRDSQPMDEHRLVKLLFDGARDGLWHWEAENDQLTVSATGMRLLGAESALEGRLEDLEERVHPEDLDGVRELVLHGISPEKPTFSREVRLHHETSGFKWMSVHGCVNFEGRRVTMAAGSITDITSQKAVELRLQRQAHHDPLTGLPNRALFLRRLERVVRAGCQRVAYAVLFVDLDRFKMVNDSLGHAAGDQLLLGIAERLQDCLRPSDMVARQGGDEFVILLEGLEQPADATVVADRVMEIFRDPFDIKGQAVYSSASVGIAFGKPGYETAEDLMRDADTAMYRAKKDGKARSVVFNPDMHVHVYKALQLENELRQALGEKQFEVHYQPLFHTASARIAGFEALLRWSHPSLGEIPPSRFLPVAEEIGIMNDIGDWVLRTACLQAAEWSRAYPEEFEKMNINISTKQLLRANAASQIARVLEETGVGAEVLHLEISESAFLEADHVLFSRMAAIRNFGVRLSIDDFGIGYSSLSYLQSYPVDELKIDKSFISQLGSSKEHSAIVRTITTLASHMNLTIVAEGIETDEQLRQLQEFSVKYVQGFHLAKPMPASQAEMLMKQYRSKLRA